MVSAIPPSFLLDTLLPDKQPNDAHPGSIHRGSSEEHTVPTPTSPDSSRPFVTLTFAQSLDAKIAGEHGKQLALSGKESLIMTHWMRTMHDAIMVGIGTALNDNPQLNTRHLPPLPESDGVRYHLPRPIILDSNLRLPRDCKLLLNYREGRGRRPWIVTSEPTNKNAKSTWVQQKSMLEAAGARIIVVPGTNGHISLPDMLSALRELGIRSLMVEGGAQVIRSFLVEAGKKDGDRPLVDVIIITVAPTFVGNAGVGYGTDLLTDALPNLKHLRTANFGRDSVVALKVTP
ncbi:riboflavin-specific deaminase [Panus rudis PR-1116 ss-1]|nr:riboflavin-specific deaminase [Panus rudis PR-1116 ss-1]